MAWFGARLITVEFNRNCSYLFPDDDKWLRIFPPFACVCNRSYSLYLPNSMHSMPLVRVSKIVFVQFPSVWIRFPENDVSPFIQEQMFLTFRSVCSTNFCSNFGAKNKSFICLWNGAWEKLFIANTDYFKWISHWLHFAIDYLIFYLYFQNYLARKSKFNYNLL